MKATLQTNRLLSVFAQGIILMWTLWTTVVMSTDMFCLLVAFRFLPENFPGSSHNFEYLMSFLKHYGLNTNAIGLTLFSMIVLWTIVMTIAWWMAFVTFFKNRGLYVYRALLAFLATMALFTVFLIGDEIFIHYTAGHSHMNQLLFLITTAYVFLSLHAKNRICYQVVNGNNL